MKMVRLSMTKIGKVKTKVNGHKSRVKTKMWKKRTRIKLIKGGINHMETIQNCLMRATVVEGQFAEDIRQEIMRKPSPSALVRNKRAQELLRKLRR